MTFCTRDKCLHRFFKISATANNMNLSSDLGRMLFNKNIKVGTRAENSDEMAFQLKFLTPA